MDALVRRREDDAVCAGLVHVRGVSESDAEIDDARVPKVQTALQRDKTKRELRMIQREKTN